MPSPRNRWNEFLSRTPFGTGISYSPAANSPEKSGCLRIRCTASLNFIKKLLGSLPDGWAYIDWIVCKLFFAIFRYFLQKEGKRIIIFSSSNCVEYSIKFDKKELILNTESWDEKNGKGEEARLAREYSWNPFPSDGMPNESGSKSEEYASGMTGVQLLAETLPENDIRRN